MIQTILAGAAIVDGSGRDRFRTDVGIAEGRIVLIGDLRGREAARRVDCSGKVLAPGFIDACSHTDALPHGSQHEISKIAQGITTEIAGNCGESRLFSADWRDPGELFTSVSRSGLPSSLATFVGLSDARREGDPARAIEEAVHHGALGVSIDLECASGDEAEGAMRSAHRAGASRAAIHLGDDASLFLETLGDAIERADRTGLALHVSHLRTRAKMPGAIYRVLETIDRARQRGTALTCDVSPYIAISIALSSLLPSSISRREDRDAILQDPHLRAAAALEMQARLGDIWHDLVVSEVGGERNIGACGMRIDALAREKRLSPARTVVELTAEEGDRARAFFFCLNEDDVAAVLSADFAMPGTDSAALGTHSVPYGNPHPRAFGTFPRVLGRFVRGRRTLSLEEAIRRMTSLPAKTFGLDDRGEIREGAVADLVLFDETTFVDTATYEQAASLPRGLERVIAGGDDVVLNGVVTNERRGRILLGSTDR